MAPRPRFAKLSAEKQQQILDAAHAEFVTHGYGAASVNRVIDAAGISKGAFYYYFDDKADLFAAVFKRAVSGILDQAHIDFEALDETSFWAQVEAFTARNAELARGDPGLMALARVFYDMPPETRESGPVADTIAELMSWLQRLIGRGQALGVVRTDIPVDVLLQLFLAIDQVLDRWFLQLFEQMGDAHMRHFVHMTVDLHKRLLAPPESNPINGGES